VSIVDVVYATRVCKLGLMEGPGNPAHLVHVMAEDILPSILAWPLFIPAKPTISVAALLCIHLGLNFFENPSVRDSPV
jgi:hypothetical protein